MLRNARSVLTGPQQAGACFALDAVWSLRNWKICVSSVQAISEPAVVTLAIHHFRVGQHGVCGKIVPFKFAVVCAHVSRACGLRTSELVAVSADAAWVGGVHLAAVSSVTGGLSVVVLVAVTRRAARAPVTNRDVTVNQLRIRINHRGLVSNHVRIHGAQNRVLALTVRLVAVARHERLRRVKPGPHLVRGIAEDLLCGVRIYSTVSVVRVVFATTSRVLH